LRARFYFVRTYGPATHFPPAGPAGASLGKLNRLYKSSGNYRPDALFDFIVRALNARLAASAEDYCRNAAGRLPATYGRYLAGAARSRASSPHADHHRLAVRCPRVTEYHGLDKPYLRPPSSRGFAHKTTKKTKKGESARRSVSSSRLCRIDLSWYSTAHRGFALWALISTPSKIAR